MPALPTPRTAATLMWHDDNLNAELLDLKLWGKGCLQYQIRQTGDDVICLIQTGAVWQVVYAERGSVQNVLFESADEAHACAAMVEQIKNIRHDHLVGFFADETAANALKQVLHHLKLLHHADQISYKANEVRFRVWVYGQDIFVVQRHFGEQLPLQQWPSMSERIHLTLTRLRQLDPFDVFTAIALNPPIESAAKLQSLEQQHKISLPSAYRTFLLEVGNGGHWERLETYWPIAEVMANNSAAVWNQPLCAFVAQLKQSGSHDLITVSGNEFDHFPGLLRVADWSNRGRSHFLTQAGDEVDMQQNTKTTMLVTLRTYQRDEWLQNFLDDIQYGLDRIEAFLTFIRSGKDIADLHELPNHASTPIAKLLAGTLKLDVDPNLNNAQLMAMRVEIDYKIVQWRIQNMGKMRDNFGFTAAQAERRAQRILSKP